MTVPAGFPISRARAQALLGALATKKIAVVGDFHLDVYWHADMRQARLSRETPHFARPVTAEKYAPGVGGVITANLCAMGAGAVYAVGVCGDDWRGSVLKAELAAQGTRLDTFCTVRGRITPTYIKPMIHGYESVQEDRRIDFQAAQDLAAAEEEALLAGLARLAPALDGIAVIDQIEDERGGIVTAGVRAALANLAAGRPTLPVLADSRARIALFRGVAVKVNRMELSRALGRGALGAHEDLAAPAAALGATTGRAVFVSAGGEGMAYAAREGRGHVPAVPVSGPIDPVGAGDSASAALVGALACGATLGEAAAFANVVASVTIRKLGETGTASPEEILETLRA